MLLAATYVHKFYLTFSIYLKQSLIFLSRSVFSVFDSLILRLFPSSMYPKSSCFCLSVVILSVCCKFASSAFMVFWGQVSVSSTL